MAFLQPKKSLGQNFLTDRSVVERIVAAAKLKEGDTVLEIGSGKGILTGALADKCVNVLAVEIDGRLVGFLQNKFRDNPKVEVIQGDILKITNPDFPKAKSYKLIANLPYYITSAILRKFLEAGNPPQEMILMVQKEVAERIVARPGQMSILGVSVQYYAQPEILFAVSRTAFDPVPEVDSAVIRIADIRKQDPEAAEDFFRVVRAGFSARRKTLANNLANSFHLERKAVEEKLAAAGIRPNVRAQELGVGDWKKLADPFKD